MPLYDYRCDDCRKVTEIRHGFNETNTAACPACGGTLKRVFNAAPIVFKGSGFYVTDSRKSTTGASTEAAAPASAPSDAPAASSPSTAPAAPAPASPAAPSSESAA